MDVSPRAWKRAALAPLLLSALLHLAALFFLVVRPSLPLPLEPATVSVEVVREPEQPKPPEAVKPPEPKPEPKPEVKPEPKPEPKPEVKPEPKPEPKPLVIPEIKPVAPPKAEHAPPPPPAQKPEIKKAPPREMPKPVPSRPIARGIPVAPLHLGEGSGLPSGEVDGPFDGARNQTLRDIMLSQVVRHWRPMPAMRGINAGVRLVVEVLPDGMLGAPFSADKPLDIERAVDGYDRLTPPQQQTLYGLVQALRVAQPFSLPGEAVARAPFAIRLDFGFDQIP